MKKISVITINYNNADGLKKTIESVVNQTSNDFEYIVIDGGSTDGSIDIINKYSKYITYWISEKDNGIYNAMNKGIKAASGEYCQFLNSGDKYNNNEVISSVLMKMPNTDIFTGHALLVYNDGRNSLIDYAKKEIAFMDLYASSISHTSSFVKRSILESNMFDESLKIVSDWKFFLEEIIFNNRSYAPIDVIVSDFDMSGCSNTNRTLLQEERELVLKNLVPQRILIDYKYNFNGKTPLEKLIKQENPNKLYYRIVYLFALTLKRICKILK